MIVLSLSKKSVFTKLKVLIKLFCLHACGAKVCGFCSACRWHSAEPLVAVRRRRNTPSEAHLRGVNLKTAQWAVFQEGTLCKRKRPLTLVVLKFACRFNRHEILILGFSTVWRTINDRPFFCFNEYQLFYP